MITTLDLHQGQTAAEYSPGIDIHLIGVLDWLMCRGVPKNKQVGTGYFIHYPILSRAHSLTIPDHLVTREII
ncbi:TPA: hypothetical protein ML268_005149 [Klebsiella pneumoniae]|nr:hypothetical protein [Klebsiella pneumoniae]HBV1167898.1 hypothetical protein [Klebsiella pneumoniae]HBZ6096318.1 hypothetical protein [Klebsiella pneumoniae]